MCNFVAGSKVNTWRRAGLGWWWWCVCVCVCVCACACVCVWWGATGAYKHSMRPDVIKLRAYGPVQVGVV